MEIKINAVGFSASSQLEDFIQKKISKLDKYHDGSYLETGKRRQSGK